MTARKDKLSAPKPNPYSPNSVTERGETATDPSPTSDRARVLKALAVGFGCCLIGPVFLASYWAYYGIGLSLSETLAFFALQYVAPGLIAVACGLLIGYPLSLFCPQIKPSVRRWIVLGTIATLYSNSFYLLISGQLNFAVDIGPVQLAAFAATCALMAMIPTALHLAFS